MCCKGASQHPVLGWTEQRTCSMWQRDEDCTKINCTWSLMTLSATHDKLHEESKKSFFCSHLHNVDGDDMIWNLSATWQLSWPVISLAPLLLRKDGILMELFRLIKKKKLSLKEQTQSASQTCTVKGINYKALPSGCCSLVKATDPLLCSAV